MDVYWLEQRLQDVPKENTWLGPNEAGHLSRLHIPKRRADWRLGRWTAKRAVTAFLKSQNLEKIPQNIEICPDGTGAPEVFLNGDPAHISISISHRGGTAVCAIASGIAMIGCDVELIEPRSAAFLADFFTAAEQAYVDRAPTSSRDKLVTLLWSAKESVLKALRVGLRVDTQCASVSLADALPISPASIPTDITNPSLFSSTVPAKGWSPLFVSCGDGVFRGWWQCDEEFVRTVTSNRLLNAPSVLEMD